MRDCSNWRRSFSACKRDSNNKLVRRGIKFNFGGIGIAIVSVEVEEVRIVEQCEGDDIAY